MYQVCIQTRKGILILHCIIGDTLNLTRRVFECIYCPERTTLFAFDTQNQFVGLFYNFPSNKFLCVRNHWKIYKSYLPCCGNPLEHTFDSTPNKANCLDNSQSTVCTDRESFLVLCIGSAKSKIHSSTAHFENKPNILVICNLKNQLSALPRWVVCPSILRILRTIMQNILLKSYKHSHVFFTLWTGMFCIFETIHHQGNPTNQAGHRKSTHCQAL